MLTQPEFPPASCALGDEHVRARRERRLGGRHAPDGLDPPDAGVVRPRDEVGRDAHVEAHRRGPEPQRRLEGIRIERATGVIDREGPVGPVPHPLPLSLRARAELRVAVPRLPSAPAAQTSTARWVWSQGPNGARSTGTSMPNMSVNRVRSIVAPGSAAKRSQPARVPFNPDRRA